MKDIVDRLKLSIGGDVNQHDWQLIYDALQEIERLRAALRAAQLHWPSKRSGEILNEALADIYPANKEALADE